MKTKLIFLFLLFLGSSAIGQDMTFSQLKLIIAQKAIILEEKDNIIQYKYKEVEFYLIADESHNRMRLLAGIVEEKVLKEKDKTILMEANFDKALDAKYALSNGVLWSVYAHPLKELRPTQVEDALEQVISLVYTYGSSYSSSNLVFGGND